MSPKEIARAAQQLGLAIRRADQEQIEVWQAVLRSLEGTGRRQGSSA
jgi:hypothetical protein